MNELLETLDRLREGVVCPKCHHRDQTNEDVEYAVYELQSQYDSGDERRSVFMHLDNFVLILSAGDDLYRLLIKLRIDATDKNERAANALTFLRDLLKQIEELTKEKRKLEREIERLRNLPEPNIPLERIKRASEQPNADVIWLTEAVEYIEQLQQHSKGKQ